MFITINDLCVLEHELDMLQLAIWSDLSRFSNILALVPFNLVPSHTHTHTFTIREIHVKHKHDIRQLIIINLIQRLKWHQSFLFCWLLIHTHTHTNTNTRQITQYNYLDFERLIPNNRIVMIRMMMYLILNVWGVCVVCFVCFILLYECGHISINLWINTYYIIKHD